MIAYHNKPELKAMMLEEVAKHRKLDQITQGIYGDPTTPEKGFCAVGCSVHSMNIRLGKDYATSDHTSYETELGIPEWLARLEDTIFEGLPKKDALLWPEEFLKAIPVGVNLEPVKWKFCAYLMKENIDRVLKLKIADDLKKQVVDAIRGVLSLHEKAIETGTWDESAARSAARSAAWSAARSAARSAAWSAAWSAAESAAESAWSAARSAARSAWSAARSAARSAAWSAARSAAESAWSAARSAAYKKHASTLIKLLKETK